MGSSVAVYIRVSTEMQAEEDKASLAEQERLCREFCAAKGHQVVAVYQDVGSGTTRNRPQFLQMLKDAKAKLFETIIAWKTDRLARGIYPCAALMEAIEESGVTIETVAEPFDRTTFELRSVLGRIEVESIKQRTSMGRMAKMRAGRPHTKAAYGYDYDLKERLWKINEDEARWVRQIFSWYIEGMSPNRIAQRLNAEKVPTKNNSRLGWGEKTVSDIVCQEYYTGQCYRNVGRHSNRLNSKPAEKWIPISVPAIITPETWEQAKTRRSKNKIHSPRNNQHVYITQHVLQCEECGTRFHINSGWGGAPRMECLRMIRYPQSKPCRLPKSVEYRKIAEQLWKGIIQVVSSEEGLAATVSANATRVKGQKARIERRLKELTAKRANLQAEQDKVIVWARKGSISEEQLERQLNSINTESQEYSTEQNRLLADLRLIGDGEEVYRQAKEFIPLMQARINRPLSEEEKLEIVDSLVKRALLDGAGDMTIELKVPPPAVSFGYFSS